MWPVSPGWPCLELADDGDTAGCISFFPPSTSSIFQSQILPSAGLRMVPLLHWLAPSASSARMTSTPLMGLFLKSSLHSAQMGFRLAGDQQLDDPSCRVPLAACVLV